MVSVSNKWFTSEGCAKLAEYGLDGSGRERLLCARPVTGGDGGKRVDLHPQSLYSFYNASLFGTSVLCPFLRLATHLVYTCSCRRVRFLMRSQIL